MNTICPVHGCELTGFITTFCPQCVREEEAAASQESPTNGWHFYMAVVPNDFPDNYSATFYSTPIYDNKIDAVRAFTKAQSGKVIEIKTRVDQFSKYAPSPTEPERSFDLFRIYQDEAIDPDKMGKVEAIYVRTLLEKGAAGGWAPTAYPTQQLNLPRGFSMGSHVGPVSKGNSSSGQAVGYAQDDDDDFDEETLDFDFSTIS